MRKFCFLFFLIAFCLSSYGQYVDMGLPSGTKWMDKNEEGLYTYDNAVEKFGNKLPTKEQLEELRDNCSWTWNGKGYMVTGPNGNSIVLPAAGYRTCDGEEGLIGIFGGYWSSTSSDSEHAWRLSVTSGGAGVYFHKHCGGQSVRLVQK